MFQELRSDTDTDEDLILMLINSDVKTSPDTEHNPDISRDTDDVIVDAAETGKYYSFGN